MNFQLKQIVKIAMQNVFGDMELSEDGKQLKTKSFFGGISQDMGFSESEDPETALLLKKYEEQKAIYKQFALMYKNDADMQAEMQEKKKAPPASVKGSRSLTENVMQ